MIRHSVLVKFRPAFPNAERAAIYADLAALRDRIPGMLGFTSGRNVSPEGLDHGFADGFSIDFVDLGARDAYLQNADHKAIGARIGAAAEGGRDGILVFDYAIEA